MFTVDPQLGLINLRTAIEGARTFEVAEQNLLDLLVLQKQIGHAPLYRARLRNLITLAQRQRRRLGNAVTDQD